MAKFLKKAGKLGICGSRESRRVGFYINPSRRGPVPGFAGSPRREVFWGLRDPQGPGVTSGDPDPRGSRRAPPRGVDVKATPGGGRSGAPDPGFRDPGVLGGPPPGAPRGLSSGPPEEVLRRPLGSRSPGPGPGLPGPWEPPGRARRGLFYINPSRRGPVPGGGVPGATMRRGSPGRRGP